MADARFNNYGHDFFPWGFVGYVATMFPLNLKQPLHAALPIGLGVFIFHVPIHVEVLSCLKTSQRVLVLTFC